MEPPGSKDSVRVPEGTEFLDVTEFTVDSSSQIPAFSNNYGL
jgi:hypothetical protein